MVERRSRRRRRRGDGAARGRNRNCTINENEKESAAGATTSGGDSNDARSCPFDALVSKHWENASELFNGDLPIDEEQAAYLEEVGAACVAEMQMRESSDCSSDAVASCVETVASMITSLSIDCTSVPVEALVALTLKSSWNISVHGGASLLAKGIRRSNDEDRDVQLARARASRKAAASSRAASRKMDADDGGWGLSTVTATKDVRLIAPKDADVAAAEKKRDRKRRERIRKAVEKAEHKERAKTKSEVTGDPNITMQQLEGGVGDVSLRLEGISLDFGAKVSLLDGASLRLLRSARYGLVGQNGCGKSTLLSQIHKISAEQPDRLGGMLISYVAQEAAGTSKSALQTVIDSDTERAALLKRESEILKSLEHQGTDDEAALKELTNCQEKLKAIDAEGAEARAASILSGLQFTDEMAKGASSALSGGWRMRLALAVTLFLKPDLLLLDEPSNHLDLHACIWLQMYLATKYHGTLLLVSHDMAFLDGCCNYTVHFNSFRKRLDTYKGNYSYFVELKRQRNLAQQRAFDKQQEEIAHMQAFVDKWLHNKFGYNRGLVQSRIKFIERKKGIEKIDPPDPFDTALRLSFREPGDQVKNPLIKIQDVSFRYEGSSRDLFVSANLKICAGDRIALVGVNGAGKSTMLKLISGEIDPLDGAVVRRGKLRIGLFSQHFVDQLDMSRCALEEMRDTMGPKVSEQELRSRLGNFAVSADLATSQLEALSGGQKARVALAKLAALEPHVLILDEPTNHLDIQTISGLCDALNALKTVACVFVSHDTRLISSTATQLWHVDGKGGIAQIHRSFEEYKSDIIN